MDPPASLSFVAAAVEGRLRQLFDEERPRWSTVDELLGSPIDALRSYVLAGGKRLRPAFAYWAFVGAGGDPADPEAGDIPAALEMLHTAALVHDDLIDDSATRHGVAALHVGFAAGHTEKGWRGRPGWFGRSSALLAGDLALVYSSRLMGGANRVATALFEEMRLEVTFGQFLDLAGAAEGPSVEGATERASRICRYKTAKYTVERPLHIGVAQADPARVEELAEPLSRFAVPLGEAFQLRDDLLGVFGDPEATGKPVGDDIRAGKPTLLAALAATTGTAETRRWFGERYGRAGLDDAEVEALSDHMDRSGARRAVERAIGRFQAQADEALDHLRLNPEGLAALSDLAAFCSGRDR